MAVVMKSFLNAIGQLFFWLGTLLLGAAIFFLFGLLGDLKKHGYRSSFKYYQGVWYTTRVGDNADAAIVKFTEAIQGEPKESRAYAERAALFMKQEDYESAVADYHHAANLEARCSRDSGRSERRSTLGLFTVPGFPWFTCGFPIVRFLIVFLCVPIVLLCFVDVLHYYLCVI